MNRDERETHADRKSDPREQAPEAQADDPHTGQSDDPRVDPTPDHRQSDTSGTAKP